MRLIRLSRGGFTLVELLVVVSIIGVLVLIGFPTFRKLQQKSRQAEAKLALGSVHTLESAFRDEYASFGSNLRAIGYDVEPTRYTVGFAQGGVCKGLYEFLGIYAPSGGGIGADLAQKMPRYFDPPLAGEQNDIFRAPGVTDSSGCAAVTLISNVTFEVSASGVLAPGIPYDTPDLTLVDQWKIDHTRKLENTYYGVR